MYHFHYCFVLQFGVLFFKIGLIHVFYRVLKPFESIVSYTRKFYSQRNFISLCGPWLRQAYAYSIVQFDNCFLYHFVNVEKCWCLNFSLKLRPAHC